MLCGPAHRRERQACPARCDHKAGRPDPGHGTSGPPLNDLASRFAPHGTGHRLGGRSPVRAKEPVTEATAGIFPPGWNQATPARQRRTGSDLGFCLRVESQAFSPHRKRSSDRQTETRLTCGAPLRNRTVDLLLTMHTSLGSLPGKHFPQAAGRRRSGSCPGLRRLRSLRPSRLQPSTTWHGSMPSVCHVRRTPGLPFKPGLWGCMPASHVHSDGQRTVRRSFLFRPPRARRPC